MKRHFLIAALALAPTQAAQLRITVYDGANLPQHVKDAAFDDLRRIFRRSGIVVEIASGDPLSTEASLLTMPETPSPARRTEAACRARRDVALEILAVTPAERKSTILGMAEPFAREGLNARVFNDRVQAVAQRQNRSHSVVLAHVIAHEIGHVLLRDAGHPKRNGLMSAVWTGSEYAWMARSPLSFTDQESRTMRSTLTGDGCPSQSAEAR